MRYKPTENHLFIKNRMKLTRRLSPYSLVIVNSNDEMPRTADQFFPFRQNSDLLYLTGISQPRTILCLCPDNPDAYYREILFIEESNEYYNTWIGQKLNKEVASDISGIKNVLWVEDLERILQPLMKYARHVHLGLHEESRMFDEVPRRDVRFANWLRDKYPLHKYERLSFLLAETRQIKEPEEIELIRHAISISNDAFIQAVKSMRPGMQEYEVEALLGYEFLKAGADGHAFQPIVASGRNACILHYSSNNQTINDGDLVLIDFGAEWSGYNADITRTIPVNGHFTPRQRKVYDAVYRLLQLASQLVKTGKSITDIHNELAMYAEKEMIQLGLFTESDVKNQDPDKPLYKKYFPHGVSHFLGLDVHDVGQKSDILMQGMVITWEPGIYIAEENLGIRLENDLLITENGIVNLSESIPIEAGEIERLMK